MQLKHLSAILYCAACSFSTDAQHPSVKWNVSGKRISTSVWMINITATLRPGWSIYSQYLPGGGPPPTAITLHHREDYFSHGKAVEVGNPIHLYDDASEMDLTWFTDHVSFLQKVKLNQPVSSVQGTVDYTVCREHTCIPLREEFTVNLQQH